MSIVASFWRSAALAGRRRDWLHAGWGYPASRRLARRRLPATGHSRKSKAIHREAAFLQGLSEPGSLEGQTITIEWRFFDDQTHPTAGLIAMAADLVARLVQAIVTSSTPAVIAAANATRTIPIISGEPSRGLTDLGLVETDARPCGNVTGTGNNTLVYGSWSSY